MFRSLSKLRRRSRSSHRSGSDSYPEARRASPPPRRGYSPPRREWPTRNPFVRGFMSLSNSPSQMPRDKDGLDFYGRKIKDDNDARAAQGLPPYIPRKDRKENAPRHSVFPSFMTWGERAPKDWRDEQGRDRIARKIQQNQKAEAYDRMMADGTYPQPSRSRGRPSFSGRRPSNPGYYDHDVNFGSPYDGRSRSSQLSSPFSDRWPSPFPRMPSSNRGMPVNDEGGYDNGYGDDYRRSHSRGRPGPGPPPPGSSRSSLRRRPAYDEEDDGYDYDDGYDDNYSGSYNRGKPGPGPGPSGPPGPGRRPPVPRHDTDYDDDGYDDGYDDSYSGSYNRGRPGPGPGPSGPPGPGRRAPIPRYHADDNDGYDDDYDQYDDEPFRPVGPAGGPNPIRFDRPFNTGP